MQGITDFLYFFRCHHHLYGQIVNISLVCRHELMKRRVEETNGNRSAFHHFVQRFKVAFLERNQGIQRFFPLLNGSCENHVANLRDSVGFEEHMLRTAQSDAFRAVFDCVRCICGCVRIGAHL